jgi:RNA 3'-terminal phosphate cyclase
MVLPLCVAKDVSRYRTSKATEHLRTNLSVAQQMTGCKYDIKQVSESEHIITIEGA